MFPLRALEFFAASKPVQLALPGGEQPLTLTCTAQVTEPPYLQVHFSSRNLAAADFERPGVFTLAAEDGDALIRVSARYVEMTDQQTLRLKAVEVKVFEQQRRFFRIDAELFMVYWDVEQAPQRPDMAVLKQVNLSGGGIRFTTHEPLQLGQLVGVGLALPDAEETEVECRGRVTRVAELGDERQEVSLELVSLATEDQDRIIRFTLAEQRRQIRTRVRVLDAAD